MNRYKLFLLFLGVLCGASILQAERLDNVRGKVFDCSCVKRANQSCEGFGFPEVKYLEFSGDTVRINSEIKAVRDLRSEKGFSDERGKAFRFFNVVGKPVRMKNGRRNNMGISLSPEFMDGTTTYVRVVVGEDKVAQDHDYQCFERKSK